MIYVKVNVLSVEIAAYVITTRLKVVFTGGGIRVFALSGPESLALLLTSEHHVVLSLQ